MESIQSNVLNSVDSVTHQDLIQRSIEKHGWSAEHNLFHYLSHIGKNEKGVFFRFEDDMGILASFDQKLNTWTMFSEVLAPQHKRLDLFLAFLHHVLEEKQGKKVWVELERSFRDTVLQAIKGKYRANKPVMTLSWPVFDMALWDPSLPGKDWKKLRNQINAFHREHTVVVVPSTSLSLVELKGILEAWKKNRPKTDRTYSSHYLHMIKQNFRGFDMTRTMVVDGKPCSITGGWKVPNTNVYYSAFGLHTYTYERLGEMTNIDDLNELKRQGYAVVDFGGSDGNLLEFKKKFKPHRFYDTITFSIRRG